MRQTKKSKQVDSGSGDDLLPREVERELARRWRDDGDLSAREQILSAYQKMAVSLAMKAGRGGLPLDDLIQEASIGLMVALDRFDPDYGCGFGTFARYYVRSRLQIYTLENIAPMRIFNTAATKSLLARFSRYRREIEGATGQPLDSEGRKLICKRLGISEDQLRRFEMAVTMPATVDSGAGFQEDDNNRSQQLADPGPGVETMVLGRLARRQMTSLLKNALAQLSERDAEVIRARHLREQPMTLDALSQKLGVSRERVRQIELRSLRRLQEILRQSGVTASDDLLLDEE